MANVPPEMMKLAQEIKDFVYPKLPPDVMFTFQLATGSGSGEEGWIICAGNLKDEYLRKALKELATRL